MPGLVRAVAIALAVCGPLVPASAQDATTGVVVSPVLTLDQERLFSASLWGKRALAAFETASAALAAENRRIEAELTAEELELTNQRATMDPAAFRAAADEFDAKVQEIRQAQVIKARDIVRQRDAEQQAFFQQIFPVLGEIMEARGAYVIIDRRVTLVTANAVDITDEAVARIDTSVGAGTAPVLPPEPEAEAAAPGAAPAPVPAPSEAPSPPAAP